MITMSGKDFNSIEREMFAEGCKHAREKCQEWLESLDDEILKLRDVKTYRVIDKRVGTIKTVMGEVSYKRHYYKVNGAEGERYVFLLDAMLGFGGDGHLSKTLADVITEQGMDMSYRKAAKAVSVMTGQSVSHGGAWNALQKRGEAAAERESRLAEYSDMGALHGDLETKVLFEEMDGVWLSMQGKDRPKKTGKRELKVATHYSGWKETAKGRHETVGKVAYAGFDEPREFHRRREAVLSRWYDTDEIEVRIVNGDGANWIRGIDEDAIVQLDPFHRGRAILRGLPDKTAQAEVRRLLREKDVDGVLGYIKSRAEECADVKEAKRILELHKYFNENKSSLLGWDERGIKLPAPPEGIVYRRLGTQEHSNCDLITHRMKRRKASWSIKGAENMAKLLCLRATGDPERLFGEVGISNAVARALEQPSAAKTPMYDGKGDGGGMPRGGWPYENAALTEGRKVIKDILSIKNI